jgi:hypothetical protein
VAERPVVPLKPGNSGGGKEPHFESVLEVVQSRESGHVAYNLQETIRRLRKEPGKPVKDVVASVDRAAESRRRAGCGRSARPVRRAGGGNGQGRQDETRLPEWGESQFTEVPAPRHLSTLLPCCFVRSPSVADASGSCLTPIPSEDYLLACANFWPTMFQLTTFHHASM